MDSFSAYSAGVASTAASAAGSAVMSSTVTGAPVPAITASATNSASRRTERIASSFAGDAEINVVGIAVGVERAHHGDVQTMSLADGDLLAVGVDHEDGVGDALHVTECR